MSEKKIPGVVAKQTKQKNSQNYRFDKKANQVMVLSNQT
jgi:hypothetical protein